jgi:serine/threonine protein kinase
LQVRALLNTGGKFTIDSSTGTLTYIGGEVRLVSLPEGCTFSQLLAVLAKTERPGLGSLSPMTTATAASALKASPRGVGSLASKDSSSTATTTTAAQNLSAAAAAVAALIAAQEAAAADDTTNATSALDAEAYATYAMHVARAHCLLRYQLPSDPSIFVDIVDDEDVQLMFEEIAELREFNGGGGGGMFGNAGRSSGGSVGGGGGAPKLRLFVQWIASPPGLPTVIGGGGGVPGTNQLTTSSRNNTLDYIEGPDQFLSPMYSGSLVGIDNQTNSSGEAGSAGVLTGGGEIGSGGTGAVTGEKYYSASGDNNIINNTPSTSKIAARNSESDSASPQLLNGYQQKHVHIAHRSASELRLAAVRSDQLECIPASEVILMELLGTGTFGDMYAGKWRECTVAVKCLNPSSVGLNYGSQAAWLAFLHDANSSAALRHPNLVEVYGIVLPGAQDQRSFEQEVQQRSESVDLALKAAGGLLGNADGEGGLMIDPKMSGRRTSWDFGALSSARSSSTPAPGSNNVASALGGVNSSAAAAVAAAAATNTNTLITPFCAGIQRLPGPCMSTPAMVMEYVSGKSLHGAIRRRDDAVAGVLARILYALDVSRGMAYLHHRGISHFDLKSTNVLLGWRNMRPAAKIAGYGLSSRKTSLKTYTPGVTMSPNVFPWISPEILRDPERVSHKADVYSFGIVLWELWALRAPYQGMDMNKLISLAVNTDEEVRPEVPPPGNPSELAPGWKELMQECWAEDPDDRPEFVEIEKRLVKMAKAVKNAQRKPEEPASAVGGGEKNDGEKAVVVEEKERVALEGDAAFASDLETKEA